MKDIFTLRDLHCLFLQGHIDPDGGRNVVVLYFDHDIILHSQLSCFPDGREDGVTHRVSGRLGKAD